MSLLPPPPRRDQGELIDEAGHDFALFRESFLDMRIVNHTFGGTSAVLKPLHRMIGEMHSSEAVSVLDIGTGSADIPLALAGELRGMGRPFEITAIDNHPDVLRVARQETANEPAIRVAEGDVLNLPFADGAFDFATCSLTFHHLGQDGCVRAMKEMDRVTRNGWVVNDGERTWLTLLLLAAFTPLVTRNPLTRHDAIASVWRCFTRDEMADLVRRAGFPDADVYRAQVGRIVVVRDKGRGVG
jgi:ubiquinone/menaquinone biosynthesis C-methylase UbiE